MKLLVAIASYGDKNHKYLQRVLSEYRSMSYRADVVVLSNVAKKLGPDVEVAVGLPARNPWSLPFAHKRLFAERQNAYDLFVYSEDDMLVTQRNIEAFLRATEILPPDELAGFFQFEQYPDGRLYFPAVHDHFHWRPGSVKVLGDHTFAQFSNDHSACYVLTREQLQRAINSGGFLVDVHEGKYDLLVTAATDPYTQCGFKKLLCISHLDDFLVAHLPNKYIGSRLGLAASIFQKQVEALTCMDGNGGSEQCLLEAVTRTFHCEWSKDYYEPCREELIAMLPPSTRNVLSIGCGWGATEKKLARNGIRVVAIPLDSIIAKCAESEGVEIVHGSFDSAVTRIGDRRFDAVLISNMLHLIPQPQNVVRSAASLLAGNGVLIASVPNVSRLPYIWGRLRHPSRYRRLGDYNQSGMHCIGRTQAIGWFRNAGLMVEQTADMSVPEQWKSLPPMAAGLFSLEFAVVGRKPKSLCPGALFK